MKAKTFLSRAYRIDTRIKAKVEQLDRLHDLSTCVTGTLRLDKVQGYNQGGSRVEDPVTKIIMAEQRLNAEIDRLVDIKEEINTVISLVANDDQRMLLELRYLNFNPWELIASQLRVSRAQVFRIHANALDSVESVLATQRLCVNG